MKHFLLRIEPVIWLLFGQGILIGTILLTGWVLVVGIAVPLGWVPAEALAYERAHRLASHGVGRLVLLGLIALPLWKGAHHLRSLSMDFGGAARDSAVAALLYGLAALGSLLAICAVVRL
ncbi:MAG TPA: fumarate reductase subunit FrdD [Myxococcota bacterium]